MCVFVCQSHVLCWKYLSGVWYVSLWWVFALCLVAEQRRAIREGRLGNIVAAGTKVLREQNMKEWVCGCWHRFCVVVVVYCRRRVRGVLHALSAFPLLERMHFSVLDSCWFVRSFFFRRVFVRLFGRSSVRPVRTFFFSFSFCCGTYSSRGHIS